MLIATYFSTFYKAHLPSDAVEDFLEYSTVSRRTSLIKVRNLGSCSGFFFIGDFFLGVFQMKKTKIKYLTLDYRENFHYCIIGDLRENLHIYFLKTTFTGQSGPVEDFLGYSTTNYIQAHFLDKGQGSGIVFS